MGWRTPCSRIDEASSRSVASSKARRGCSGLESMWSTSITLTPVDRRVMSGDRRLTIAGGSSRSSERRRAAAARKSVLAKFDHLPGEHTVDTGGVRGAGVRGDRPPGEWRLAQLHAGPHDALELSL